MPPAFAFRPWEYDLSGSARFTPRRTARHAACLLRGKRRAGLRRWQPDTPGNAPAATAKKRPSPPAQCPRCLRLTPSLRFRPLSATAPFAPDIGGQGLAASGGLLRAGLERRRMLRNRLAGFGRLGFPSLPLARGHWQARLLPSLPRPPHGASFSRPLLLAVSFVVRCGLPSRFRWSAIEHNAWNYAQRKKRAVRLAPA